MATSRDILCGICEAQHITKHADHWCPECDEGLCAACENHHKISRGTKNNININIYHCQGRFLNASCIEFASLYKFLIEFYNCSEFEDLPVIMWYII
jgi:hypothetical protein